jgi:hypothetical protein
VQLLALFTVSSYNEARFGDQVLDDLECTQYAANIIVCCKVSIGQKDRPDGGAFAEGNVAWIDEIEDGVRRESEAREYINQIARRDCDCIRKAKDGESRSVPASKMIGGLATMVVEDYALPVQPPDQNRRCWRQQEGPVRG